MLKYTLAAVQKIYKDVKKLALIIKYITLIFMTSYFIYVLVTNKGIFIVNVILASLFVIYTIFEIVTYKKQIKTVKKVAKRIYRIIKIILKGFTLGVSIYSMYISTLEVSPITIILATIMIILWIIQILFEVVTFMLQDEIEYILAGINEDIVRPYINVTNIVGKLKGETKEYIQPYPKEKKVLEELIKEKKKREK
ncbi:MAG: hypothetical protein IJX78_02025 [Bacilli bacterium]|nr:hypothetical protein [Bacilli bacterium]